MKNITVSVDDQTHRLARIRAAELDTSVSALVREYLRSLAKGPDGVVS
jgi:plasmid stability protein